MTVQDTTPQVTFVGTGAQLVFAFTFRVDEISWLSVDFTADFDTFTINEDQDGDPGGTVEYLVAPPLAQNLTVIRDTPNAQDLDYTRYDPFDSESHEFGLDKLTMQIQDLQDLITTTLTQDFDLLGNVDFATKVDGSMVYWDVGALKWKDTAGQVRFVGGQFTVDAVALFNGNVSIDANLSSISGNFHRFLNATNLRQVDLQVPDLVNFQITTPNLVDVLFSGFSGRVKQDLNVLAYVSEIVTSHLGLTDIGVNTHVVIDAHIANAAIHFTEGSIDHTAISNIGVNSHVAIDTHIGTPTIHFTVGSIDHTAIANIGVNSHAALDAHVADTNIHFADAPADANSYVRNNNAWVLETVQSFGEYRGEFDASIGTFPVTLNQGDWYNTTVAGTVDGQAFAIGDILVALVDTPSTTIFAANWSLVPNISVTDHTLLTNIGVNTHAQLDTHLADATIHFTEASIDHTNIANIGTNTHAVIDAHITAADAAQIVTDAHIADATIHFTEASIDHTAIANIGVNSHAAIDAHIADGTIHLNEAALDILYLRLDTANDPLTGELVVQDVVPGAHQTRNVGLDGTRFLRMDSRLGVFVGESNALGAVTDNTAIRTFNGTPASGIMAGNQVRLSTGVTELQLQGGAYKAVATLGNVFSYSTGDARILNVGGGAFAGGSAFGYGAGDALINATGPATFTWVYAYSGYGGAAKNHTMLNSGIGSFLSGYSYGVGQIDITSSAQGSFVQGFWSATNAASGITIMRATGPGGFAQGAIANGGAGTSTLEAAGDGSFAQGHIAGLGTIRASGDGAFAQGRASASGIIEATAAGTFAHGLAATNDIRAIANGAFAIGDATAGNILASGVNSCQFGPGTNALADTFQIGNGGIRFKGTTGAPSALQNGDVWVASGYMYFRTNGVSVKMVACP